MAKEPEEGHSPEEEDEGGPVKSFLEHLEDLRWVLIKSSATISVAMLICLIAGNYVVGIIKRPLEKAQIHFPTGEKTGVLMFGKNRVGTYPLDADQWETLNAGTNVDSGIISPEEITELNSLASKLKKPSDRVSEYLSGLLLPETRSLLINYDNEGGFRRAEIFLHLVKPTNDAATDAALRQALTADLNRIIQGGAIYDAARFKGVPLSAKTAAMLKQNLQGQDLARLNRKLLLCAYPQELSKNPSKFLVVRVEPKNEGTNLMLGLSVDDSADAERLASQMHVELSTLSPAGGFFVAVQVAFYGGLAMSSPFIFYFIAQFVFPALKMKERHYIYSGLGFSVPLFMLGVCFCYFVLMPVALAASQLYSNWLGFSASIWRAEEYISFVCKFMLGMGLGFQMPVVLLVLVKLGILNYGILSKARRYMIVINLILGALLTTPEVITQVLMFIPLQLLYEISVWIAWYWERRDKKRAAAEAAGGPEAD